MSKLLAPEAELSSQSEHELIAQRRAKLAKLRTQTKNPYPNDFQRDALAAELHTQFDDKEAAALEASPVLVKLAGRMMLRRLMGKASFVQLQDMSAQIQIYVRQNDVSEGEYEEFLHWDRGDIIAVEGLVFKTKTGELSIKAQTIRLLSKSLRPLPDKFHGLADQEVRYRQRYLDLL